MTLHIILFNFRVETKYLITTHFDEKHTNQNVTCCCECLEVIPKGSNRLRRHILKSHHSATGIDAYCYSGVKLAMKIYFDNFNFQYIEIFYQFF